MCGGGGGGMTMNDAFADINGVGRGGRPIRRGCGSLNGTSSDSCDNERRDVNRSLKA